MTGRRMGSTGRRIPWQAKFGALALIWGASFLLMKIGLEALAPVQIAALRILCGAATVLATAVLVGARLPRSRRVWGHLAISGFFLCSLPFTLFPLGEERVSSALAGIGNATTPLATVLFTLLLVPADRVPLRTVWAVLGGFVGVVVIMQPWQAQGRPDLLGFGMTLLAGASYGLGWTYVKRALGPGDVGGLGLPAAQLLMASAEMVVVVAIWWLLHRGSGRGQLAAPWSPAPDSDVVVWPLVAVLALGIVGTGLAFALQFDVVRTVGPTMGTTVTYVIPVVAVVLGIAFLHERLDWPQVLGAAIVLAAAVVIGRPRRRAPATAPGEAAVRVDPGIPEVVTRPVPTRPSTGRS